MTDLVTLSTAEAESLIARALIGSGVQEPAAASVARALVAAEAEGQVGHGFSRLADYAAQARSGKVNTSAKVTVDSVYTTSIRVDADHGFAYPALDAAFEALTEIADTHGTAVAAVTRSHHCGALSVQVDRIARRGLIGIMMANTPSAIAPWGAKEPIFGTNPIAFAAPRPGRVPLVVDMSLSKVARGKVMHAYKSGKPIPEGWALDTEGRPTTDPAAGLAGSMVPIGEAKGSVLALMVEMLASVFTGASLSADASSFFEAEGPPPGTGQFLLAIKPQDGEAFAARIGALLELVAGLEGARLPGSRREAAMERSRQSGIDVPEAYVRIARDLARADV